MRVNTTTYLSFLEFLASRYQCDFVRWWKIKPEKCQLHGMIGHLVPAAVCILKTLNEGSTVSSAPVVSQSRYQAHFYGRNLMFAFTLANTLMILKWYDKSAIFSPVSVTCPCFACPKLEDILLIWANCNLDWNFQETTQKVLPNKPVWV